VHLSLCSQLIKSQQSKNALHNYNFIIFPALSDSECGQPQEVKLYDGYYYTVLDYLVLKPKVRAVTMLPHCSCAKMSVQYLFVNLWCPVAVFCIILNDDHSTAEWLLLFAYG
jgi:hypothetical protein